MPVLSRPEDSQVWLSLKQIGTQREICVVNAEKERIFFAIAQKQRCLE